MEKISKQVEEILKDLDEMGKYLSKVNLGRSDEVYTNFVVTLQETTNLINNLVQDVNEHFSSYKLAGYIVRNKLNNKIGIILKQLETGQIQVLESIQPFIINTHDNFLTLEIIDNKEDK